MTNLAGLSTEELLAMRQRITPDADRDALVRTVWGEARGEGSVGRKAVAAVIRNRSRLGGKGLRDVVMEKGQFEPWANPRARAEMEALTPDTDAYQSILADIEGDDDPTGGATHFYAPRAQSALGRPAPQWDNGSGADIGNHRFFRLNYGGSEVPVGGDGGDTLAPPDLTAMSVEDLQALRAKVEADPPEDEPVALTSRSGGVTISLADIPALAMPESASRQGRDHRFVDPASGESSTNTAQGAAYAEMIKAGRIDPAKIRSGEAKPGSADFPLAQQNDDDLPKPGDWYVAINGDVKQVPETPWAPTLMHLATNALPMLGPLKHLLPDDPRFAAMERGAQSGALLGGRNEVMAGLEALPQLTEGAGAYVDDFKAKLGEEDRASGQAMRDYPMVYGASAVGGALPTMALAPTGFAARAALGGGAGFLATDGDLARRGVGAGLGVIGGEALNWALPRLAGKVMDMTGLPMRAAGASRSELRAAEAADRYMIGADGSKLDDVTGLASREGIPTFMAGGDNLVGLADVVAQSPGKGQTIVRDAVSSHRAQAVKEVKDDLASAMGAKGDYFADVEAQQAARQAKVEPILKEAFDQPIPAHVFERKFAPIMARLPKGAIEEARDLARKADRNPDELGLVMADGFDGLAAGGKADAGADLLSARDFNALKRGVTPSASRGNSLLAFIAKSGGIHDFAGELGSMDAQMWHKTRPFLGKLVRDDGASVDDMATQALEAGYFPERAAASMASADNMHPVTPEDLYSAIREELAGRPRYARDADAATSARAARLEDIEARLRDVGLDPARATLAEARAALAKHGDDIRRLDAFAMDAAPPISADGPVMVVNPTLETLHYIKKGIDQTLEQYRNGFGRLNLSGAPGAQLDASVRSALAAAMRDVNPDYRTAMKLWGDDSDRLSALALGRDVFSPKFDMQAEKLSRVVGDMSEAERANFSKGVGEAILYAVRTKGAISEMRQLLKSEEFADRVRLAFPNPKAFDAFMAKAATRVERENRGARVVGGSQTYNRQAIRADLEAQGRDPLDMAAEAIGTGFSLAGLSAKALKEMLKALPRKDRSVIGDPAANEALAKALTDPDEMTRLLNMLELYKSRRDLPMRGLPARTGGYLSAEAVNSAQ